MFQKRYGLGRFLRHRDIDVRNRSQNEVISIETVGALALGAIDLRVTQARLNRAHDVQGDLILQRKNVFESSIVAFRPDMSSRHGIDELLVMRTRSAALRTLPSST